ncbi:MAG TPA: hypothetical protein HA362_04505 [Nanoarchaeota archaeon]|nr:hypothetical protein [Nanoarchaeota archaeon]
MEPVESRLLGVFYMNPMGQFHIRQIGRETGLDTKTVMKHLKNFARKGIVFRKKEKNSFPFYEANRHSALFRYGKTHALLEKIYESGLIGHLEKELEPKAIVLFGSVRKGTYHEKSDIDIFVQAKKRKMDLPYYEKKLKHRISLFFEESPQQLSRGLLQNIYNGIVLSGELEL